MLLVDLKSLDIASCHRYLLFIVFSNILATTIDMHSTSRPVLEERLITFMYWLQIKEMFQWLFYRRLV